MEYSIQELSHLSGVTTRTLRWYDQIGLLKPSRVGGFMFAFEQRNCLSAARPSTASAQ